MGLIFENLYMCLENKNSFDIKQNWTVRQKKKLNVCVCLLRVG